VVASLAATRAVVTFAAAGWLMAPLPLLSILAVLAAVVVWAGLVDGFTVRLFQRLGLHGWAGARRTAQPLTAR
jgi:hypothetical protein